MRIKVKILLSIITTLVLILFVSTYYTHRVVERNYEAALREEAGRIVRQIEVKILSGRGGDKSKTGAWSFEEMMYLSSEITPDVEATKFKTLNETLEDMIYLSPHIIRLDIFSLRKDGTLAPFFSRIKESARLVKLTPEDISLAKQGRMLLNYEEADNANYANVIAPVYFKGSVFGLTEIKISRQEFDNVLTAKRKTTFLFALAAFGLIAGVLVISINYMVNRPIQDLLSAISRVKEGNLSVTVTPAARDEIGRLTEHFNEMIGTIRRNSEEKEELVSRINRHNDELQSKIRQATVELLERNEELSYANQSIYNMQKKLGHSRRLAAVGQLAATVAHELGTPLHSVSGHLQLLMEEPALPGGMHRRLVIMQSQLERITHSIQNILNTTRPPEPRYDLVDSNKLLEDIIILVMPETISKQIRIEKDFQKNLPPVFGSRGRFEGAFLNLLDNAIDASSTGASISVSTRCCPAPAGRLAPGTDISQVSWVQVSFKDNGRGIPENYLKDIFEPFYTTKANGHGTGLGLAITREIIQSHQGFITVDSRINEGSTFTVFLPSAYKR